MTPQTEGATRAEVRGASAEDRQVAGVSLANEVPPAETHKAAAKDDRDAERRPAVGSQRDAEALAEAHGAAKGDDHATAAPKAKEAAITQVRAILAAYVFRANDEADLQAQVAGVLESCVRFRVSREVRVVEVRGRYDILIEVLEIDRGSPGADQLRGIRLVLELKVGGNAEAAERQAQRYAQDKSVDAVVVVTSSQKLARRLMAPGDGGQAPLNELGGKPFAVIALRSV